MAHTDTASATEDSIACVFSAKLLGLTKVLDKTGHDNTTIAMRRLDWIRGAWGAGEDAAVRTGHCVSSPRAVLRSPRGPQKICRGATCNTAAIRCVLIVKEDELVFRHLCRAMAEPPRSKYDLMGHQLQNEACYAIESKRRCHAVRPCVRKLEGRKALGTHEIDW